MDERISRRDRKRQDQQQQRKKKGKLKPIIITTDNYYPLTYELIIELFLFIVNNDFPLIFIIFNVINYNIINL